MKVENDAGVENVFQYLFMKMANVSSALYAHGISLVVQCFYRFPKYFRHWVIQMKLCTLLAYCLRQIIAQRFFEGFFYFSYPQLYFYT